MQDPNGVIEYRLAWGSPQAIFREPSRRLELAFMLAIVLHIAPLSLLWHKQATKKPPESILLQDIDLIEPEIEQPAPPPVEVVKPKNVLEFIKMAIPILNRPKAPEIRDEVILPKPKEPKLAEPEKLIEKRMAQMPNAPEIKLDANKNIPAPKIIELAKLPSQRSQVRTIEPALKLEEVGKKAVAVPVIPSISLDSRRTERPADLASITKARVTAQTPQLADRLVEKNLPSNRTTQAPTVLGYSKQSSSVRLDQQPREVVRSVPKPHVEKPEVTQTKKQDAAFTISKERVKITGPLANRKEVQRFVPSYPAWAKAQDIEADVAIRFTVNSLGDVTSAVVQRASGYQELDKLAMDQLKKWKFVPLKSQEEQWGIITFRYLME